MFSAESICLFVCHKITSERLNIGWWNSLAMGFMVNSPTCQLVEWSTCWKWSHLAESKVTDCKPLKMMCWVHFIFIQKRSCSSWYIGRWPWRASRRRLLWVSTSCLSNTCCWRKLVEIEKGSQMVICRYGDACMCVCVASYLSFPEVSYHAFTKNPMPLSHKWSLNEEEKTDEETVNPCSSGKMPLKWRWSMVMICIQIHLIKLHYKWAKFSETVQLKQ